MDHDSDSIRRANGTFRRGVSGNPAGRTRGSVSLVTELRHHLREHPEQAEAVVAALLAAAQAGDAACIKLLLDRLDGPVALKIEGLSQAQMTAVIVRVGEALKRRLPKEHHQAIAEAILEATGEEETEREVEALEG